LCFSPRSRKKMTEVIIGTSDDQFDVVTTIRAQKPAIALADVAATFATLEGLLYDRAAAGGADAAPGVFPHRPHRKLAVDFDDRAADEAAQVADIADTVLQWATAEGHFPDEDSVLAANDGTVEALFHLLVHDRSPVVLAGLECIEACCAHADMRRLIRGLKLEVPVIVDVGSDGGGAAEGAAAPVASAAPTLRALGVLDLVFAAMRRFPNKEELQCAGIAAAERLAPAAIEPFLTSDLVSAVLAAMTQHKANAAIQRHSCQLLARTVNCVRADPLDAPVAILYAHIGCVLDYLLLAVKLHPTSSPIAAAVVHCVLAMCRRPENAEPLMGTTVVLTVSRIAEAHVRSTSLAADAVACLALLVPEMADNQHRDVVLFMKRIMSKVADTALLAACCALGQVIATAHDAPIAAQERELEALRGEAPSEDVLRGLLEGLAERQEEQQRLRQFMVANVAQVIGIALQHFGGECEELEVAGDTCLRTLASNAMYRGVSQEGMKFGPS
jgi:hypothetical protein